MKATLINKLGNAFISGNDVFEITQPRTVVGRKPWELSQVPEFTEKLADKQPFQFTYHQTDFIVIPQLKVLSITHFEVIRLTYQGSEIPLFFIRDLGSRGGTFVNGRRYDGWVQLQDGDSILHDWFEFHIDFPNG